MQRGTERVLAQHLVLEREWGNNVVPPHVALNITSSHAPAATQRPGERKQFDDLA